jgi:hypothetical protein
MPEGKFRLPISSAINFDKSKVFCLARALRNAFRSRVISPPQSNDLQTTCNSRKASKGFCGRVRKIEEVNDALDNLYYSSGFVADRSCFVVHLGRVHSPTARDRSRGAAHSAHHRAKARFISKPDNAKFLSPGAGRWQGGAAEHASQPID